MSDVTYTIEPFFCEECGKKESGCFGTTVRTDTRNSVHFRKICRGCTKKYRHVR